MNLRSLDLNLLVALDALLEARHVTRAARALGMSQSAMSHALARLRAALDDELLVRGPSGLVPTARAEALREPLRQALSTLDGALDTPRPFDPGTARRAFTVAATDYVQLVVLPRLVARLQAEAPGVELWVVSPPPEEIEERLAAGTLDLEIGVARRETGPGLLARRLFDERFVCAVRRDHPTIGETLSLDEYVDLPHAFVAPRGRKGGVVDSALAKRDLSRRVALAVPHFLVMPTVIASSDLIVTLASRVARGFAEHLPLRVLDPPIPLPAFSVQMAWHERAKTDPGHQWLRALLVDVTRELDAPGVERRGGGRGAAIPAGDSDPTTYRPFTGADLPVLEELVLALYAEDPSGETITVEKVRRTAAELLARPEKGRILLFEVDGAVVGYAIVIFFWSNEYGGDIATIDELFVRGPWRSRGIGADFLAHVATTFEGAVAMQLEVTPTNERALALYERQGFHAHANRHLIRRLCR